MKVVDRFKVNKPAEGPRKFTFEFTAPGLVSVVVVTVFGLLWVFILGVLVGRGYKPENAVPELAQIMPAPSQSSQPEQKEPPTVLKPEELQFMESLQGKKSADTVTVDSTRKSPDKPAETKPAPAVIATSTLEKTPAPLPKGQVATAPAQPDKRAQQAQPDKKSPPPPDKKAAQADKKAAPEPKTPPPDKKTTQADKKAAPEVKPVQADKKAAPEAKAAGDAKFTAVYQVAAFDDKKVAQQEADRYASTGLKTSIHEHIKVDGKPVYRVLAQFKGTDTEIKAAVAKLGSKKPILREKKPL
jgi:hypothetical protein